MRDKIYVFRQTWTSDENITICQALTRLIHLIYNKKETNIF